MTTGAVIIAHGLPEAMRRRAAELYYAAFQQKLEPIFRAQDRTIDLLAQSFDTDMVFVALHGETLVGLAGMQHGNRQFVSFTLPLFTQHFGWTRGTAKLLACAVFERHAAARQLLMDGIVVDSALRGQGVGTQLFAALRAYAAQNSFNSIRLDVVDTNPAARRLYERLGFVATQTTTLPGAKYIFGFGASTTMIKHL